MSSLARSRDGPTLRAARPYALNTVYIEESCVHFNLQSLRCY